VRARPHERNLMVPYRKRSSSLFGNRRAFGVPASGCFRRTVNSAQATKRKEDSRAVET
jgi:hypothetical protein